MLTGTSSRKSAYRCFLFRAASSLDIFSFFHGKFRTLFLLYDLPYQSQTIGKGTNSVRALSLNMERTALKFETQILSVGVMRCPSAPNHRDMACESVAVTAGQQVQVPVSLAKLSIAVV
jgi:hypothetical protein